MTDDDEHFGLDSEGNRVLIGLSVEETREFETLENTISKRNIPLSSDEWDSPNEKRWLELYEKHWSALKAFLKTSKTRH